MSNVLDDFYLPLLEQEKHYLSKEYKLLKKNKIDTAEFDGFEKDRNAGEVKFTEATEDDKKELYNEVLTFAKALPKDLIIISAKLQGVIEEKSKIEKKQNNLIEKKKNFPAKSNKNMWKHL